MTTSSVRPVLLRDGASIEDPLRVVLGFLKMPGRFDVSDPSRPESFGEPDLRLANRGGARISAAQIAAILQRRRAIERALQAIPSAASLSGAVNSVPWLPLSQLFDAFADIRGVGLSKMTKALYPKRPALIPMLDSMVQTLPYLVMHVHRRQNVRICHRATVCRGRFLAHSQSWQDCRCCSGSPRAQATVLWRVTVSGLR